MKNNKFNFLKGKKTPLKNLVIGGLAAFSAVYLVAPTGGLFEFIPDMVPFIGNLDEVTATMMLLAALKYFGFDLMEMFTGESNSNDQEIKPEAGDQPIYYPPKS
ncbi:MAG: hypothetical protein ACK481_01920 [Candidatus Melainabacteria bacterium]|jgi:uncharacterized membrane protein YkvA (DUF1232 family)